MNTISKISYIIILVFVITSGIFVYYLGTQKSFRDLEYKEIWKTMNPKLSSKILESSLKYGDWRGISRTIARDTLPFHLDVSDIPYNDIAIPSEKVHSGRYIISQWQRVASGTSIVVLGKDIENDLCIALGSQKGELVIPKGYMESPLPKEDLTGLKNKGASRINRYTNELVYEDSTLEDNAIREVKEEIGINILKSHLKLIDVVSGIDPVSGLYMVEGRYGVILSNTPMLETLDKEFLEDDMQHPFWVKIKDITCKKNSCYALNSNLPLQKESVLSIQKFIRLYVMDSEIKEFKSILFFGL